MLSAFATSTFFLVCYIWYHAHHCATRFPRQGAVRDFYLTLLGSHTILAVVIVPFVLTTLYRAWRGGFERHKKIARWTLPLWFYVSVTGVIVLLDAVSLVPTGCRRVRVCAIRQKLQSGCRFP
jgi:putative membrane protein